MTSKSAGFDFGLSYFLTSSENEQIKSLEFLKQSLEQLKAKSKQLSAKIKASKNRYYNRRGIYDRTRRINSRARSRFPSLEFLEPHVFRYWEYVKPT